jgi:hypothetical protein
MQINNVLAGYSDPTGVAKRGETVAAAARGTLKSAETTATAGASNRAALTQILAQYDVKDISPTEFSEMAQKLRQTGAISDSDFQELAGVRGDMEAAGVEPDQRIDLSDFYAQKVKQAQNKLDDPNAASNQQLAPLLRRYDWVQKFALMHSNPQAAGIDAVA